MIDIIFDTFQALKRVIYLLQVRVKVDSLKTRLLLRF